MSQQLRSAMRPDHRGFSLVELMISLAIGLVLAAATMSAYLGSSGAFQMAAEQSRMNENAQAALNLLAQNIRMAGYNPQQPNRVDSATSSSSSLRNPVYGTTTFTLSGGATSNFFVRGCDATFSNIETASSTLDDLTCGATSDSATTPDSIAVSYEADATNTIPTSSGTATDCLGAALPAITATLPVVSGGSAVNTSVSYTVADNRFYIATPANSTVPNLYCRGNGTGSTAQPLVENIENLQFNYGVLSPASTTPSDNIAGYLSAAGVVNNSVVDGSSSLSTLAIEERWLRVISVRICVVVRSEAFVTPSAGSASYLDCAGALTTAPDRRLRRAYSTTVLLRNRTR